MSHLATCITLIVLLHYSNVGRCSDYANTIVIDPRNGRDTEECISGQSLEQPCQTLSWAFNSVHRKPSTLYILKSGTHFLNGTTDTFNSTLSSLAFEGYPQDSRKVVIHCTAENTGLAFEGVKTVKFTYLTFYNCSALRNSTSQDYSNKNSHASSPVQFQVGLYFYLCADILMENVNVSDSPNATGVVIYDTTGTNRISNSVFQRNIISRQTTITSSPHGGGGGFYVEFTYCKPGDMNCQDYQTYGTPITGASYYFTNCNFTDNQAYDSTLNNRIYLIAFQSNHVAFGRGGGLSIFIKGESHNNTIEVRSCNFEGNSATWGGGMLMELHDYALSNSLNIISTTFRNNSCQYSRDSGTYGGGLRVGHCVYLYNRTKQTVKEGNKISIKSCNFYYNKGFNGGGLSLVVPRQNTTNSSSLAKIDIIQSIFAGNAARLGSALHIDGFALILFGQIAEVNINSSEFENNTIMLEPDLPENFIPYQGGLGAVYIHGVNVAFQGGVTFSKNLGTGLAAVSTRLSFRDCAAIFSENQGVYGGGIALLGSAHLMINEKTRMEFVMNYARLLGGAIYSTYISRENSQDYTHCIIRHTNPFIPPDSWGAKFIFQGNMDLGRSHPNSIHTTSILPCSWAGGVGVTENKSAIFCWKGWSYAGSNEIPLDCASQLSTDSGNINFTTPHGRSEVEAFSGFPFNLQMSIVDDLSHNIRAETEFIAVTNTSGSTLGTKGQVYSYVWGENTTVSGKEGDEVILQLHTNDQRVWYLEMSIKILPCPPGFKQLLNVSPKDNETSQLSCVCSNDYEGAVACFIEQFFALLKNNNWMGRVDNESLEYLTAPCPPGYCHYSTKGSFTILPNNSIRLEGQICGSKNRQGVLCGKCAPGYETAVNSPIYECVNCTNVNVPGRVFKYIAVKYIPIVVIFFVIMLFGIRLTSGPANAFIIYAQVISSTSNLNANGQIPLNLTDSKHKALMNAFGVPYGIFNLELLGNVVEPFCIGTGLDTLTVISLEYIVALLPLLMIVFAIAVVKIGNKIGERCNTNASTAQFISSTSFIAKRKRNLSKSLLPSFAAFLLLSYTKFSLTSSYIMHQHHLIDENGTPIPPKRVYYSGHFTVNDKTYILLYFIPSVILFSVFAVMPPLLLLHYPVLVFEWCLEKVQCLWRFYPATKVHIFLDTFQGCFKIKYRFFAGLYFLFRLVINTTIMLSEEWTQQCIVQLGTCIIMVMLVAICQPYNKENDNFNRVDVFIFANLAFINAISLYFYEYAITPVIARSIPVTFFAFQYVLVFLPLFYMMGYVIWDRTKPCHKGWKKSARKMTRKIFGRWKGNSYKLLENSTAEITINPPNSIPDSHLRYQSNINSGAFEDSEEVMFHRAELENTYQPRNRLVTIVETNHGQEGEASLRHTTASRDSGVRSAQSSPAYNNYGSTGEGRRSLQRNSTSGRSCNKDTGNNGVENEQHKERHSTKSYQRADNSRPESDNRHKTS